MEIKRIFSLCKNKLIVLVLPILLVACGGSSDNREVIVTPESTQNSAPSINIELSNEVAMEFREFTVTISVVDDDDDPVTVEVENLPAWAEFDPEQLLISGFPQIRDVGSTTDIVIIADDGIDRSEVAVVIEVVDTESIFLTGDIFGVEFDDYVVSLGVEIEPSIGFNLDFFQVFESGDFNDFYFFDVPIDFLTQFPDELLVLRIRESFDTSSTVTDLMSVLGTAQELIALAGDDGVLTSDELSRLNLSPVSTAKYLLSTTDELPESTEELIDRENSLLAKDVVELAALYQFVLEESFDFGNRRLTEVFSQIDLTTPFEMEGTITQLDLETLSVMGLEEILASVELLEPTVLAESGVSNSLIVTELPGISLLTQPFFSGELPYVVADVADIGFNGRGEFYHRYNEGLQWIRRFGWNVSDSQFTMEFDSAQEPGRIDVPRSRLISDFGFDQDVVDFFANLEIPQDLIQVRSTDLRTDYNVVFVNEDRWHIVVEREVENSVGFSVSRAGGSFNQFPPVTHTITESRVLITSDFTDNRELISSTDLIGQPWALPSRDIIDFDRQGLDRANVVLPEIYTLFDDGITSDGDDGGPVYEWVLQDNDAIILEVPFRESFTINPIFELDDRYFGYVEEEFNGFPELLGAVEFSKVNEQSALLFNNELILPSISSESAPIWLRVNGKRSPENFREDGLLQIENVSGFLFDQNGALREVNGTDNECLENNTDCFEISEEASVLVRNDNPVVFLRDGDFDFSLNDFTTINTRWRVLSYDQDTETVVIIFSEIDDPETTNAETPPILMQLQKRNLNEWREEFQSSTLVNL